VKHQAFPAGHEAEEIRMLWQVTRQKVLLDEVWLSALLDQRRSAHLHIVPPSTTTITARTPVASEDEHPSIDASTDLYPISAETCFDPATVETSATPNTTWTIPSPVITENVSSPKTASTGPTPNTVSTGSAPVREANPSFTPTTPGPRAPMATPRVDWADALAVPTLYGREQEQAQLIQWIVQEHCQVASVLGMGGIGKSTLVINTMYRLAKDFEVVIFRSVHDAPSCEALLAECLQALSPQPAGSTQGARKAQGVGLAQVCEQTLGTGSVRGSGSVQGTGSAQGTGSVRGTGSAQGTIPTEQLISQLLSRLRQVRALVVLDNLECLLKDRDPRGHFRPGFEGYGWLLRRLAETQHQSCLLLTSREKPVDLRPLEGKDSPVHSLRLGRLDAAACQQIIEEKGAVGSQREQQQLIEAYSGNPLALKLVGETIVDLFGGEIGQFLGSETLIFGSITDLLDEQFARLTVLEQTVLYWLAIVREPVTFDELLTLLVPSQPRALILEAIDSLRQRSLIECGKSPGSFMLQSVLLEYVTAALIAEVSSEIQQHRLDRLIQHSLFQATAHEYMRQMQERLLLAPLLAHLQSVYPRRAEVEERLLSLLDELRKWADYAQGYGPANLIALLRLLRGHLSGLDLTELCC